MHLSSVIPANDTRESVFEHKKVAILAGNKVPFFNHYDSTIFLSFSKNVMPPVHTGTKLLIWIPGVFAILWEVLQSNCIYLTLCLFGLILYHRVNSFSVMSGQVFLGWTSTKQRIKCLAQWHNAVPLVRLELPTPQSQVKHSTTKPLRSYI